MSNRNNLINKPLTILTSGNVVSYACTDGKITAITFKFKDFYYKFDVTLQSIEEDPTIKIQLSNLPKSELFEESWSR